MKKTRIPGKTVPIQVRPISRTVPVEPEKYLWPILIFALILRIVFFKFSQASPFYEPNLLDAKYYQDWALQISHGDFGNTVFYGLPLYPFFLGATYFLSGDSLVFAKFAQILLGVATVYFIYRIARELAGERVAILSAMIAACYGPLVFHEAIFIPEAAGIPLYAAAFFMMLRYLDGPTPKKGLVLGAIFGLAMLTKAGILLFVLAFCAAHFLDSSLSHKSKKPLLYCMAAFLLVLAPVTAHNVLKGKDLVLLTSHSGFNFYIGNNEKSEGVFVAPEGTGSNVDAQIEDSKAVAEREMGRPLKPSEISHYWSRKAWTFIFQNPFKFVELSFKKLLLFFDSREISDVEDYQFAALFNPFLRIPWPNFSFLGPFLFLGLVAGFSKLRHRGFVLLWIAGYLLGMMVFFVNARYRLPLLPVLIPVATLGLVDFCSDFIEWKPKKLLASALILAAGFGLTRLHLVGTNFSRDFVNAGDIWLEKNQPERALPLYEKAIEIDSHAPKAFLAKALALTKMGRPNEAKEFYEKSLELDPKSSQANNNLGLWYEDKNDLKTAETYFLKAVELKPHSNQAHNNLGMVYGKTGRLNQSIEEFERAIKISPSNPRGYTNLGLIYYQKGNKEKAKELWQKALSVDPLFPDAQRAYKLLSESEAKK